MSSSKTPSTWIMFVILLISAITVSVSQLKISAVLPQTAEMLSVDLTQASLLMSLFTVAGIVLSIPGAALMGKTGSKNMLLILMGCLVVGNVIGAVTDSFPVVMASRIIEGVSYALIITVGVSLINMWFEGGMIGTATGIFNTFAAAANFIAMNGSLMLLNATGNNLKMLWWVTGAIAAVCFALVLLFIREPERAHAAEGAAAPSATIGEALKNPALIFICIAHLALSFVLFSIMTCYPQIFSFYGIDQTTANFYSSLNGLFGIPVCIICGIVVGKTGKPFHVAAIGAIGTALMVFAIPYLGPSTYVLHVLASAIFPGGLVMTSIFIITPMIARSPKLIPLSMGVLNTLYYIGVFASTPVITALSEGNTNWVNPSLVLTAASVVVLVCVCLAMAAAKKQEAEDLAALEA